MDALQPTSKKRSLAAALKEAEAAGSENARHRCAEKKEAQRKVDEQNKQLAIHFADARRRDNEAKNEYVPVPKKDRVNRDAEFAVKRAQAAQEAAEKARMRAAVKLTVRYQACFSCLCIFITYGDNRYRWKRRARVR